MDFFISHIQSSYYIITSSRFTFWPLRAIIDLIWNSLYNVDATYTQILQWELENLILVQMEVS